MLESYKVSSEGQNISIKITEDFKYIVGLKEFPLATLTVINQLKNKIIEHLRFTSLDLSSAEKKEKLKEAIRMRSEIVIREEFKHVDKETADYIISDMVRDMLGLGKLDILLNDEMLEEINIVSSLEPVRVYHKKYGWLQTNIFMKSEDEVKEISTKIAREVGKEISNLSPLLDAHLSTGDRVNAVLKPITPKGNSITIRKFAREPWTVVHFIKSNTCSVELFALIWMAMQYESSILVSGGTGSGKTSMLNVMMPFIPPNHRIVSIEDTRELQLQGFLYWEPTVTREPNPEGKGGVRDYDLMINSLRMRPDRIILGEIRKKETAEVFFEALHTGHSVYGTVHANNAEETVERLINPPIGISPILLKGIDLNIVMFRDRRKKIRRVAQVAEFIKKEDEHGNIKITDNPIYEWDGIKDKINRSNRSQRFMEQLQLTTGMSDKDVNDDLKEKVKILSYMVKKDMTDINEVGKIMKTYYTNIGELRKLIK
jgi:flagellar protein FlaI